jgi:hypothetical protein
MRRIGGHRAKKLLQAEVQERKRPDVRHSHRTARRNTIPTHGVFTDVPSASRRANATQLGTGTKACTAFSCPPAGTTMRIAR